MLGLGLVYTICNYINRGVHIYHHSCKVRVRGRARSRVLGLEPGLGIGFGLGLGVLVYG